MPTKERTMKNLWRKIEKRFWKAVWVLLGATVVVLLCGVFWRALDFSYWLQSR